MIPGADFRALTRSLFYDITSCEIKQLIRKMKKYPETRQSDMEVRRMETVLMYVMFAVGVVLIVKGGDWFVDGAVWVAEVTGIPKFIIGATIVSLATTLPEIMVSTMAAV